MRKFRKDYHCWRNFSIDLFVSEDVFMETAANCKNDNDAVLSSLMHDSLHRTARRKITDLEKICDKKGKNKIAILNAHGGTVGYSWCLFDGHKSIPVQEWVKKHDSSRYAAILLDVCNPNGDSLEAKNTHVFYPDNLSNLRGYANGAEVKIMIAEPNNKPS